MAHDKIKLGKIEITNSHALKSLGVLLDENLTMVQHINQTVKKSFYELRQLRIVIDSLNAKAASTLVHALINTRLDYCNSLLTNASVEQIKRLQRVQNSAARLITGTGRREHITPVLRNLHWLPVKDRISFKILSIVDKCLKGEAPKYLSTNCKLTKMGSRPSGLRSNDKQILLIPRTRSKTGDHSFKVLGPVTWNTLPPEIRDETTSHSVFLARRLKTYFFKAAAAAQLC